MNTNPNINRPDVVEGKYLETAYKLDSISFEDARWILHDFIQDVLIGKGWLNKLSVSPEVIDQIAGYNKNISDFLIGMFDSEEINRKGYEAWGLYDNLEGNEKYAIAFVIAGLGDKKKAFYDEYGPSMHFQSLLSNLNSLGQGMLCKKFREYLDRHSRMKKYTQ